MECIVECKKTSSCLSFSFNNVSRVCFLYDKDFVNVADTQATDEIGWNYYHVVPGGVVDKSQCELQVPTLEICQSFCFFYRYNFPSDTIQDFIQACSNDGGKVIKVDRYLKQYCMEKAIDPVIEFYSFAIDGMQDETTGEWTYFDGTKITYFYWDIYYREPQPNYVSPIETPGKYEGYLATHKSFTYRWHDAPVSVINGVACEIE